jgi:hypothetical protein
MPIRNNFRSQKASFLCDNNSVLHKLQSNINFVENFFYSLIDNIVYRTEKIY